MTKATRRSAVLLGLTALGMFVLSVPSFAEVQNVKVGGDLTVRGFHRRNLDLNSDNNACGNDSGTCAGGAGGDVDNFVMQAVAVNISADLTENVSAMIRLANETDWGTANLSTLATDDVNVSQAYITLKELFYAPLTVRVGDQPIKWGRGLVLGSNLLPSVLSTGSFGGGDDRNASITANEYTDFTAFPALRATLDLSGTGLGIPLTVDGVYIKLDENSINTNDDANLIGVNVGTHFDEMKSEAELYYLVKRDRSVINNTTSDNHGTINTFGIRGSASPAEGSLFYGEIAYQAGKDTPLLDGTAALIKDTGSPHSAWLMNLGAEYTFAEAPWTPKAGFEWIFKSGRDKDQAVQGWDPIAPSYFPTLIRSYETRAGITGLYPVDQAGVTSAFTNQTDLALYGSAKPIEDLQVDTRYTWFVQEVGSIGTSGDSPTPNADSKRNSFLGSEWDSRLTYNYTDDVSLSLAYGIFWPGSTFRDSSDNTAQQLITEARVAF